MTHSEYQKWRAIFAALSEERKEDIRAKARWEHVTLLAVFRDWPSLFGADGEALHAEVYSTRKEESGDAH